MITSCTDKYLFSQGLKGMDINGLSDPFCKLNLLPVGAKVMSCIELIKNVN